MKANPAIVGLAFLLSTVCQAGAADIAFRVWPDVSFPISIDKAAPGDAGTFDAALFTVGGGGTLAGDLELFNVFAPSIEAGFRVEPTNKADSLLLASGGIGLNLFAYPIPRLKARAGAGGGLYLATYGQIQAADWYWKARAEIGYRFTPTFTLSAGAEYTQYLYRAGVLYSGLSFGITADVSLSLFSARESGIAVEASQRAPVFPIFYTSYERVPIGTVKITNTEQAEIRNVEVSFLCGSYSSKPKSCASFPVIAKGQSVEAPLYASFNDQVLTLSESTKIQAELIVDYSLLDTRLQAKKAQTILFNHRNLTTWEDDLMLAAFVSPNDPAVLEYSKYVAGLVRDRIRAGIDGNLQYGLGFFEGLRLSGITYTPDPTTPYVKYHGEPALTDYLQYPSQTLAYKSGDCDDLAVLYAAVLKSIAIDAAFIPLADELCVAFPLRMAESEARAALVDPSTLIYRGGKAWLPLRMSLIREGFMAAWLGGAKKWNDAAASGATVRFFTVEEAWQTHSPVGITGLEAKVAKPSADQITVSFENAINRFITREIGPRVQKLEADIAKGGTDRLYNSLGLLYARYGLLQEGKAAFLKAAVNDFVPALTNLGNIAFLQKNFEESVLYFEKVLGIQPNSKAALIGLAKAKYELDQFTDSDALFSRVQEMDPALASQFAYLSSRIEASSSRASAVADRGNVLWASEEQ
jgi:tetratricopeptide (TPR) repeat protein